MIGWELAAALWRGHLPDLTGGHPSVCAPCQLAMPCLCWRFADVFLADACEPPPQIAARVRPIVDEATRELRRVSQERLPRRQPGTYLAAEERYDGWFTR